jgi:protein O-GlcNAc transferase
LITQALRIKPDSARALLNLGFALVQLDRDAEAAGLPLLTYRGRSFAGRVAASLLRAVGVPELATDNFADYEAMAVRLARDPPLLASVRQRLKQNRRTHPLFDIDRFRRHIEAAYTTMWESRRLGEPPRSFAVTPIG